jgi:hypothetical protein
MIDNPDRSGGPPHLPLPLPVYARHPERAQRVEGPPHLPLPVLVLFVILFLFVILTLSVVKGKNPRIGICRCLFPTNTLATCNPQLSLSSPSTPKNPSNPHRNNHLPPKNSWHTSYARLGRIKVWIESEVVILAQPWSCHSDPEAQPKVEESPYWVCFAAALQGLAASRSE